MSKFFYYYGSGIRLSDKRLGMQDKDYFVLTLTRLWELSNKAAGNTGVSIGYQNSFQGKSRSYTINETIKSEK